MTLLISCYNPPWKGHTRVHQISEVESISLETEGFFLNQYVSHLLEPHSQMFTEEGCAPFHPLCPWLDALLLWFLIDLQEATVGTNPLSVSLEATHLDPFFPPWRNRTHFQSHPKP